MALLTAEEAKAHCRVTHDLEDDLFTIYIAAANDWIKNYLNLETFPQTSAVKAAALLIVQDLYQNRGVQTDMQLYKNNTVDSLLYPYRQNMGF